MQVPYVMSEEAEFARHLEDKLLAKVPETEILFVGVTVEIQIPIKQLFHLGKADAEVAPVLGPTQRRITYHLYVGCAREREEKTIGLLVEHVLVHELAQVPHTIEVHRGKIRGPQQST